MTEDTRTTTSAEKTVVEDPRVERSRTISSGRTRAPMSGQDPLSLYGQSLEALLAGYGFPFPNHDEVRFEVEGNLGSGAFGEVYAVIDRSLKRPVAAKVFTRCSPDHSDEVAQFVDEARITASLQHPNVLPVYDLALSREGRIYFTMKRIDGSSLGDAINRSTAAARTEPIATFNAVVGIFKDVANALSYAHHRGVLHLDVKPDNIMLGSFGETLLVDWGSALRIDAVKPGSSGTPLFMSPEQARREVSDPRCDVYALGATLFTALTLRCPTWADDSDEFWRKKRTGTIDPPTPEERARIPPALLDIALKAIAPDRADRYPDMRSLLTDLESYQAGLAVSAHRETVFERLRRWHRKRAAVLWSSVAGAAAILALAALLYGEKLKEVATWGNPVVVEDFSAPELGPHWKIVEGAFAVRDGRLVSGTTLENVLVYERVFQGDVAIEYDAEMLAGTNEGDCSLMWQRGPVDDRPATVVKDRPSIAPREVGDSFYIQFGGASGTTNTIKTEKGRILSTSRFEGRTGVVYRVRIEIVDTRISLMIDGRTVCECIEPFPVTGGSLALYGYDVGKCFDRLRVFTQGVPRKIAPTAIGDAYVRDGLYPLAIERYADVVRSFPGQDIADEATYKTGLCHWRSGDHAAARTSWRPLAAGDWADLVLLHELEDQFEAERDQHVREGLIHLMGKDRREDLRSRAILLWADFTYRLTAKARITGELERLKVYLDMHDRSFTQRAEGDRAAAGALLILRRPGEVLERYPEQVQMAVQALSHLGRPEEALVRYPTPLVKRQVSLQCGLTQEMDLTNLDDLDTKMVLIAQGRAEALLAKAPRDAYALIASGRLDDILTFGFQGHVLPRALIMLGREHEISDPIQRATLPVMMAQGRYDDAFEAVGRSFNSSMWPRHMLGLLRYIEADHARAFALLTCPPEDEFHQINFSFAHYIMVPFLRKLSGDRTAFAASLAGFDHQRRYIYEQKPWHFAQYLTGVIDEAGFLSQPHRIYAAADLLLLRGVRNERAGQIPQAIADYRAYLATPRYQRSAEYDPVPDRFCLWRIGVLVGGLRTPDNGLRADP